MPRAKYPTVTIQIELGPGVLKRVRDALVRSAMIECRGNISHAAALIGVHRQSMQRLLDAGNRAEQRELPRRRQLKRR